MEHSKKVTNWKSKIDSYLYKKKIFKRPQKLTIDTL